jgi:tetratricopeptide (TPR) repeat protein
LDLEQERALMHSADELMTRAKAERDGGDVASAEASYGKAAEMARIEGLHRLRAHALRHVAELAAERSSGQRALDAADEAVAIYRSDPAEPSLDLANAYRVRALAFSSIGNHANAAQDWRAARDLYRQVGITAGVDECDRRLSGR